MLAVESLDMCRSNDAGRTWHVEGEMTAPGGSATIGESTLTYDKAGRLTSGNLDLPALTIAGLVPIEGVSLAYGPTGWSGAGSGGGVDIAFVVTEGERTSGPLAVTSEQRAGGKEGSSPSTSRWSPDH